MPETADAAAVVFARAHLERYRVALADVDLSSAREALKGLSPTKLGGRDYDEYLVGLGEALYYDDQFGAAAECFAVALSHDETGEAAAREKLFDWWAGALDQQAQIGPESDRKAVYQRILDRRGARGSARTRSLGGRGPTGWPPRPAGPTTSSGPGMPQSPAGSEPLRPAPPAARSSGPISTG